MFLAESVPLLAAKTPVVDIHTGGLFQYASAVRQVIQSNHTKDSTLGTNNLLSRLPAQDRGPAKHMSLHPSCTFGLGLGRLGA